MSFLNRISLSSLIKNHIETLYDDAYLRLHNRKIVPKADLIIFLLIPLTISTIIVLLELYISDEYLSIIFSCLSIFAGLLFGLLSLIFQLTTDSKSKLNNLKNQREESTIDNRYNKEELRYRISKELFINVGFAIMLAILAIVSTMLTRIKPPYLIKKLTQREIYQNLKPLYLSITNFLAYFIISLFLLTILMVLKRFYLLFINEVSD